MAEGQRLVGLMEAGAFVSTLVAGFFIGVLFVGMLTR
jgi:hypothetical protein